MTTDKKAMADSPMVANQAVSTARTTLIWSRIQKKITRIVMTEEVNKGIFQILNLGVHNNI